MDVTGAFLLKIRVLVCLAGILPVPLFSSSPDTASVCVIPPSLSLDSVAKSWPPKPLWWSRLYIKWEPDPARPVQSGARNQTPRASRFISYRVNKQSGASQYDFTGLELGLTLNGNSLLFHGRARSGEDSSRFSTSVIPVRKSRWHCLEVMGDGRKPDSIHFRTLLNGREILSVREPLFAPAEFVSLVVNPVEDFFPGRVFIRAVSIHDERPEVIPGAPQGTREIGDGKAVTLACDPYVSDYEGDKASTTQWSVWRMPDTVAPYIEELRPDGSRLESFRILFPLDSGDYCWSVRVRNSFGFFGPWSAKRAFTIGQPKPACLGIDSVWLTSTPDGEPLSAIMPEEWFRVNIRISPDFPWKNMGYFIIVLHSPDYPFGNPGNKGGRFLKRDNYVANIAFQPEQDFLVEFREKRLEHSFSSQDIPDTARGLYVDPSARDFKLDTINNLFHFRMRLLNDAVPGRWTLKAYSVSVLSDAVDPGVERYSTIYRRPVMVSPFHKRSCAPWIGAVAAILVLACVLAWKRRQRRQVAAAAIAAGLAAAEKNMLVQYLLQNLHRDEVSRDTVLAELKISRTRFYELLAQSGKDSLPVLINELRIQKALELLGDENLTVSQVAYQVGFQNPSYFIKVFKKSTGKTPVEFRESSGKNTPAG